MQWFSFHGIETGTRSAAAAAFSIPQSEINHARIGVCALPASSYNNTLAQEPFEKKTLALWHPITCVSLTCGTMLIPFAFVHLIARNFAVEILKVFLASLLLSAWVAVIFYGRLKLSHYLHCEQLGKDTSAIKRGNLLLYWNQCAQVETMLLLSIQIHGSDKIRHLTGCLFILRS